MSVESLGRLVVRIHIDQGATILPDRQIGKSTPETATEAGRCDKQHFDLAPLDADEPDGAFRVPGHGQMSDRRKSLPYDRSQTSHVIAGKEVMGSAYRVLPQPKQLIEKRLGAHGIADNGAGGNLPAK